MGCSKVNPQSANVVPKSPLGFTLVELLVVITIIGILIALLLPAVQAAREAARRVQCSNNLKQIGLAMHNYHLAHECFPPGKLWESSYISWASAHHRTNWGISLLPYLEQENLYDKYVHEADNTDPVNAPVREAYVPVYVCASDTNGGRGLEVPAWGIANDRQAQFHYGSYRGMGGRSDLSFAMVPDHGHWSNYMAWRNLPPSWKGVFHIICPGLTECESFSSIKDGTSSTIAFGERHRPQDLPRTGTFWAYSSEYGTSDAFPFSETLRVRSIADCQAIILSGKPCHQGWLSYHPDGVNFVMCDGSVHFLSTNVNMDVFCGLATVAGGETVQVPQ